MTQPIVVIGAGGFGRETMDVIEAVNRAGNSRTFDLVGVVDDSPSRLDLARLEARGIPWIGTVEDWLDADTEEWYIIGIGNPLGRAALDDRLATGGRSAASVVHPRATIGSMSVIGPGSVVCSGVEISTNVSLGRSVHVNPNATIGHDSTLGACVSINPGAIVSGAVTIGKQSLIGAGAVILQGLSIGEACVVGASACVTRSVLSGAIVKGVPAR